MSLRNMGGITYSRARGPGHTPDPLERRRTLLIVEDNDDTTRMLRKWLETRGYEVAATDSGWEAVQMVLHGLYDAILMDMSLPGMDGMIAVRLIRTHQELHDVPVVAITAYDKTYPRAEAINSLCDEYMVKPIDFQKLEAVLRQVLR